jgi:hypothetical protein
MKRTLFTILLFVAVPSCAGPDAASGDAGSAAVAEQALPVIRYYAIADT